MATQAEFMEENLDVIRWDCFWECFPWRGALSWACSTLSTCVLCVCVCVWGGSGGLGARHCSPVEHIKDEMCQQQMDLPLLMGLEGWGKYELGKGRLRVL